MKYFLEKKNNLGGGVSFFKKMDTPPQKTKNF